MKHTMQEATKAISDLGRYLERANGYTDKQAMKDSVWAEKDMNMLQPPDPQPSKEAAMTDARCRDAMKGRATKESNFDEKELEKAEDKMVEKFLDDFDKHLEEFGD